MTPLESWAVSTAKAMLRDLTEEERPWKAYAKDEQEQACYDRWADELSARMEQKLAICLVQARARQCRDLGTMFIAIGQGSPSAITMFKKLDDINRFLEGIGLKMANHWPLSEDQEPAPDSPKSTWKDETYR